MLRVDNEQVYNDYCYRFVRPETELGLVGLGWIPPTSALRVVIVEWPLQSV